MIYVRRIKVPLLGAAVDGAYEVVRDVAAVLSFGLSKTVNGGLKDSSHEAVEITLEACSECGVQARWTLHFGTGGKMFHKAYYNQVYKTANSWTPNNLTLGKVNDEYDRMWNSGYNLINRNCCHWAVSLWKDL